MGIVESGVGTTASMLNMFRHIGAAVELATAPDSLSRYSHLVLPGVGHFTEGTRRLAVGGWTTPLREFAASGKPMLGVCLGMQLLGVGSAEGPGSGLSLLPYSVEAVAAASGLPVPHMGWNTVQPTGNSSPLLDLDDDARFYFVHSFAVSSANPTATGTSDYGKPFASVVGRANVHGVQFHPEKSHRHGMTLLRNFTKLA